MVKSFVPSLKLSLDNNKNYNDEDNVSNSILK